MRVTEGEKLFAWSEVEEKEDGAIEKKRRVFVRGSDTIKKQ